MFTSVSPLSLKSNKQRWVRSFTHPSPVFTVISRGPEEEEQVGLCNPCDPGPAHPHHHHRDPARRRLCDNHR